MTGGSADDPGCSAGHAGDAGGGETDVDVVRGVSVGAGGDRPDHAVLPLRYTRQQHRGWTGRQENAPGSDPYPPERTDRGLAVSVPRRRRSTRNQPGPAVLGDRRDLALPDWLQPDWTIPGWLRAGSPLWDCAEPESGS